MDDTTGLLPGCKECGQPLVRRTRTGLPPTHCSGKCRAKAGYRRAKAEGRNKQWTANAQAKQQAEREANARHCPYCGDLLTHPRRVQCGKPECKRLWTNERNRAFQLKHKAETGKRYSQTFTHERTCEACGKTWDTTNAKARYCSNACQAEAQYGPDRIPKKGRAAFLKRQRLLKRIAKAAEGTRGTIPFVAGPCGSCGTLIITRKSDIRWCSAKCKIKMKAARRRAAKRAAFVENVSPLRIFERDRWRCQLCGDKVERDAVVPHPLAPTLDHIIPLAKGGKHEAANVQLAHFLCNSTKSDRGGGQLLLIG